MYLNFLELFQYSPAPASLGSRPNGARFHYLGKFRGFGLRTPKENSETAFKLIKQYLHTLKTVSNRVGIVFDGEIYYRR